MEKFPLEKGEVFAGFTIQDVRDGDAGRVFLFVKGNEGVYITMKYEDYFDMISNPYSREQILDNVAAAVHTAFKDKASGIWSR